MRKWLIVLSLLFTGANAATVWTWVDEAGQVHYSDTPVPGARQIEITDSSRVSPSAAAPRSAARPSAAPASPASQAGGEQPSRVVRVVRPAEQETLWNIGTQLEVQLELGQPLRGDQRIDVVLDGQRRNLNTTSTQLVVGDVFRGMHTLQAVIVDATGAEVFRSDPVTFMVQQTSTQNPNNPNARRR